MLNPVYAKTEALGADPGTNIPAAALSTGQPTSVYLYYDRAGILLYVGITATRMTRQRQHNSDKDWWQYVDHQEVEHYPNRPAAMVREKALISAHRPPFNKQHNADQRGMLNAYLAFTSVQGRVMRHPRAVYSAHGGRLPLTQLSPREDDGRLVLRSLIDDYPIIGSIKWKPNTIVHLTGHCKAAGQLRDAEIHGPVVTLTFQVRSAVTDVTQAWANLRTVDRDVPLFDVRRFLLVCGKGE